MEDTKSIFLSKTAWGAGLALAATFASLIGYTISPSDQSQAMDLFSQTVDIGERLIAIGGSALAIWGRIKATHKIG